MGLAVGQSARAAAAGTAGRSGSARRSLRRGGSWLCHQQAVLRRTIPAHSEVVDWHRVSRSESHLDSDCTCPLALGPWLQRKKKVSWEAKMPVNMRLLPNKGCG
jgi:hypothetical protein